MNLVEKKIGAAVCALLLGACGAGGSISGDIEAAAVSLLDEPTVADTPIEVPDATSSTAQSQEAEILEATTTPGQEPTQRTYTAADITDLILVTGQSNALGLLTAFDTSLDSPKQRVFAFTNSGWQRADLHQVWDRDWYPRGNPGDPPSNNFAFHMAREIVQRQDHRVVGFILATAPGQSIDHWKHNSTFSEHIDNKVVNAINEIPHKSQLDGILWHQGESDEGDTQYHQKLDSLISTFRQQNWFSSQRPFICGETAAFDVVNRQLMALNNNGDVWSGCVDSENLGTHIDGFHFDAEGLRELGKRYAEKYLDMIR